MRHMTKEEARIRALLRRARTIAVVGASPRVERHSNKVTEYLAQAGYDVIPVRPDRRDVAGLRSFARLSDFGGPVDIVVAFRRADAIPAVIEDAAAKKAEAIWLPPGVWTRQAQERADALGLWLIRDRCIQDEHRHVLRDAGHPLRSGFHRNRFREAAEAEADPGFTPAGGGGHRGAGGKHTVLDEKKWVTRGRRRARARRAG